MIRSGQLLAFKNNIAAITPDGQKYTYKQILEFRDDFKNMVESRSLVFCLCDNSIGSLIGYISLITSDIVPLMLDGKINVKLLHNLIDHYQPNYIWVSQKNKGIIKIGQELMKVYGFSLIKIPGNKYHELNDNLCLLLPTSGSTGSPKLVRLSYKNVYSNAQSIAKYLSINDSEKPITSLPMQYSFGLSIINSHLIKGATILLTNRSLMEKEFWSFMKRFKSTSLSGVPYTFEILKKLRFFNMSLPYLKTITQAGGKLEDNLNLEFSKFCKQQNKRFFVMYGQTEATARMSYLPCEYSITKCGSVGVAIPNGKFHLIDEKNKKINGPNLVGELIYEGENVSMGYANNINDLAIGDINNGILKTGDLAKRDHDDYYYIVGRKKRFIKLFGNRVNIDHVENLIKSIISDCACTGEDDSMSIFINDKSKIEEIRKYISQKLNIHISAFDVKYIAEIPKNSSGKINYNELIK